MCAKTSESKQTPELPASRIEIPQRLINMGFAVALALAGATLVGGSIYLMMFMGATNSAVDTLLKTSAETTTDKETLRMAVVVRMIAARLALLSCGIAVAMSFGFLGFALFLLGVRNEMTVDAQSESYHVKAARMSPGVFIITCASILVGICATRTIPYEFTRQTTRSDPGSAGAGSVESRSEASATTASIATGQPTKENESLANEFLSSGDNEEDK